MMFCFREQIVIGQERHEQVYPKDFLLELPVS
jgi:hypothetical protein